MYGGAEWDRDGANWPNSQFSQFIRSGPIHWHVQVMGQGPTLLLVHGTAASTHSWRHLAPLLATHFTVVAPDLPGHAFTQGGHDLSLPGMANALAGLLTALGATPVLTVGHSAGAAILAHMALRRQVAPGGLVAINGAFLPFRGMTGRFFPSLAKLLVLNPLVPQLFAWTADSRAVARLIRETGSTIDADGLALYGRLMRLPGHVAGALRMMARWDLESLSRLLPGLDMPLLLMTGDNDLAIRPLDAQQIASQVPGARLVRLPGLGHLAHEEDPDNVANLIVGFASDIGLLSSAALSAPDAQRSAL